MNVWERQIVVDCEPIAIALLEVDVSKLCELVIHDTSDFERPFQFGLVPGPAVRTQLRAAQQFAHLLCTHFRSAPAKMSRLQRYVRKLALCQCAVRRVLLKYSLCHFNTDHCVSRLKKKVRAISMSDSHWICEAPVVRK